FQRKRKIHDGIAQVARRLPVIARRALVGGEEGEVHALELFRADALNKAHLVAGRFQLPQRLVVIEQPDIDRGKIPFMQDVGNLFSLKRRRAHDGHAIKIRAAKVGLRVAGLGKGSHGAGVASGYAGGAGGVLRRKIHCSRHRTPEAMYRIAMAKSVGRENRAINATTTAITTISRKGRRERKSISLKL